MANLLYINVNIPDVPLSFKSAAAANATTYTATASGDHYRYGQAFSSNGTFTVPKHVGTYELDGWYAAEFRELSNNLPEADYHTRFSIATTIKGSLIVARTPYLNSSGGGSESNARDCCIKYRGRRVTVLLDANGGTVDGFLVVPRFGETYGELPTPERTGWTFAGWYTEREGGDLVSSDTVVETLDDHTLYAHWERDPMTVVVHFVPCGGTVDPESMEVTSGSAYGELPIPVRDGYEFKGWYTASLGGEPVTADTIVGRTFTHWLYAQWTKIDNEVQPQTFDRISATISE